MRITLLLILASWVAADEPAPKIKPLTLALKQTTATGAKWALEQHPGIERVDFAPQVAHLKVDIECSGLQPEKAIEQVATAFGCEAQKLGAKRWLIAPAWKIAISKNLVNRKLAKVSFKEAPLSTVLDFLRAVSGSSIHLDPEVDATRNVTLQLTNVTFGDAVGLVTELTQLKWELRYGVVYIASAERLKKLPVVSPRIKGMEKRRVMLQFDGATLPMVANYMQAAAGVQVVMPRGAAARAVSVKANVSVEQAFALIFYPLGLTAFEKDGVVHVQPVDAK